MENLVSGQKIAYLLTSLVGPSYPVGTASRVLSFHFMKMFLLKKSEEKNEILGQRKCSNI